MATLYTFTLTVDGNLGESDFERLDQQLAQMDGLEAILRETVEKQIADTTFSPGRPIRHQCEGGCNPQPFAGKTVDAWLS